VFSICLCVWWVIRSIHSLPDPISPNTLQLHIEIILINSQWWPYLLPIINLHTLFRPPLILCITPLLILIILLIDLYHPSLTVLHHKVELINPHFMHHIPNHTIQHSLSELNYLIYILTTNHHSGWIIDIIISTKPIFDLKTGHRLPFE